MSHTNINPLRELNRRNREFWDKRMNTERMLLENPDTAHYVLENLRAEAFRHAYDIRVKRELKAASSQLGKASAELKAKNEQLGHLSAELQGANANLHRIHRGVDKRQDQRDRAAFIAWVRARSLEIGSIAALLEISDFRWAQYRGKTLRTWYKEAMPHVKLRRGRPTYR